MRWSKHSSGRYISYYKQKRQRHAVSESCNHRRHVLHCIWREYLVISVWWAFHSASSAHHKTRQGLHVKGGAYPPPPLPPPTPTPPPLCMAHVLCGGLIGPPSHVQKSLIIQIARAPNHIVFLGVCKTTLLLMLQF